MCVHQWSQEEIHACRRRSRNTVTQVNSGVSRPKAHDPEVGLRLALQVSVFGEVFCRHVSGRDQAYRPRYV